MFMSETKKLHPETAIFFKAGLEPQHTAHHADALPAELLRQPTYAQCYVNAGSTK